MTGRRSQDVPEVYPVREDSRLLARFARPRRGERVLEIGCGRGAAALVSARHGASEVVATDLNPAALRALLRRARSEGLPLSVVRTDLAAGVRRFNLILSNPPYLPTLPSERDPNRWVNLALDGGPDGCRVTARLLATLPGHLARGGRAYVLVSSRQSRARLSAIRRRWVRHGGTCRTTARERWGDETLSVWCLSRASRRIERSTRGTGGRRRVPLGGRSGSNRGAGRGRTIARDGA
jgi:release factor glutamine methyltransferase